MPTQLRLMNIHSFHIAMVGILGCCTFTAAAIAQSGTTGSATQTGSGTTIQQGSGSATGGSGSTNAGSGTYQNMPLGLNGYCPVCIIDMKKWVQGSREHSVILDGKLYLFPGEEQQKKFLANTTKYTPALGGNCIVCYAKDGSLQPGSIYFSALHMGRLYLFPSENEKRTFMASPQKYENLDLALDGKCTVCRVEMQKDVMGKAEFGTVFQNKRYYFPSQEQKMMFLKNPTKYIVK